MKRSLLAIALLAPVLSWACTPDDIQYSHDYVRAMAPGQHVTAVYMDITNTTDEDVTIVDVSSPDAEAMMHTNVEEDGKVRMEHLDELVVPANSTITLQPGGDHIMLTGLEHPLTPKSKPITLVFTYDDGSTSTINTIPVRK